MEMYGKVFPIAVYFECANLEMICSGTANYRKKSLYCEEDLYRIYVITIGLFLRLFNDACQMQINGSMIGNDELRLTRKKQ
jgi:hypothetical protein